MITLNSTSSGPLSRIRGGAAAARIDDRLGGSGEIRRSVSKPFIPMASSTVLSLKQRVLHSGSWALFGMFLHGHRLALEVLCAERWGEFAVIWGMAASNVAMYPIHAIVHRRLGLLSLKIDVPVPAVAAVLLTLLRHTS